MSIGWQILDAYFAETRYPRTHNALEGYDHFIRSGLGRLIQDLNPFSTEGLEIHIGGRDGTAFELVHPEVTPNHARLYDCNYSASLVASVLVVFEDGEETLLEGVALGDMPIMLHSCICRLRGLDAASLSGVGECPYDEGGYFIVDGKEKALVAQEHEVTNRALVMRTPDDATYEWRSRVRTLEIGCVRTTGQLTVLGRVSGSASTFALPLFTLFRLLGMETDFGIMAAIRRNGGDAIHTDVLDACMRPSVVAASPAGYTYVAAMDHAVHALRPLLRAEVAHIVKNDILHNVPADEKPEYLAAVVADMLRVMHGIDRPTDRDSVVNKRVVTSGARFADLFRDQYNTFRADTIALMERGACDDKATVRRTLQTRALTDGIRRGLRGESDVPRDTMHGAMSHLSMISTARAAPHGSHWGVVCPIDDRLAVMAHVTAPDVPFADVERALHELGAAPCATGTPVWLNGTPVGRASDPLALTTKFRGLRRNGHMHRDVSITWRPGSKRVEVACDAGRLARPVLVLHEGGVELEGRVQGWAPLLPGHDSPSGAPIEYLDCAEAEDAFIAMSLDGAQSRHTHCEIHPSTILSLASLLTPFSHHSLATHNMAACRQVRTCASLFATSFNSRMDPSIHLLHAGQRPAVSTLYASYCGADTLAYGVNALIAVIAFDGYNQGGSIIMNVSSLQRGLFNTTHYQTLVFGEESDGQYICNPAERQITLCEGVTYAQLDRGGLPVVGSLVEPGVVIVGRVTDGLGGQETESSLVAGPTVRGVVDRVLAYPHPRGSGRRVKVRLREERVPTIGDMFSSRHGQEGVVARLARQEDMPFLPDGTVPDLIINPQALPSQVAHLMEAIGAKAACRDGEFADATPLTGKDNFLKIGLRLSAAGAHSAGSEVMYSPASGRQLPSPVNFCPTYYLRLNQMVADKVVATRVARRASVTGQPAPERTQCIGEPECEAIVASGMSAFLKESMLERSDIMAVPAHFVAGQHEAVDARFGTLPLPSDAYAPETEVYNVPQALTVLQKELASMGIAMALQGARAKHHDLGTLSRT
jgi:DNA-directed RNA polymerase beta subunit